MPKHEKHTPLSAHLLWYHTERCLDSGREHKQTLSPEKIPHISPLGLNYGVFIAIIWEEIDRVITASHCIMISGKQSLYEFW